MRTEGEQIRCRLISLISDHPTQQGIRKGGGPDFWSQRMDEDEDEDEDEDRMAYSRQLDDAKIQNGPFLKGTLFMIMVEMKILVMIVLYQL